MSYGLTWNGDYWGESAGILVQDVRMPFLAAPRVDVKELEFVSPQPFADSSSESVESRILSGDTLMAILNNGNVMVDAVYVIKNGGTASAAITIANTTRGETMLWSSSLAGGKLTINSLPILYSC